MTKRTRRESGGGGGSGGDDDGVGAAAPRSLGGGVARQPQASDVVDEDDADGDDALPPPLPQPARRYDASALRAEDIPGLNTAERRLVLCRWNSRLRSLKNRVLDISYQFPTSNVMVCLSKPFPTERRQGRWCEEEFLALGPMTRVTRDYRLEENLEDVQRLSGSQILRRTVADLTGVVMHENEKAVGATEYEGGEASLETETEAQAGTSSAKTLDGLYKKLLPLVAAELHPRLAHELVQSGFVRGTGAVPGATLMKKSKEYVDNPTNVVVKDQSMQMMDPDDAPKTDEERRLADRR